MTRKIIPFLILTLIAAFAIPVVAQESAVKGNLSGTVYDSTGAVVPGAKVTLTGGLGPKTVESDNEGHFMFPLVTPGFYSVRVEKQGFKASEVKGIEVATNRTSAIRMTLEPGAVTEVVEVKTSVVTVDTSTTAVGANLTDSFYTQVPAQRNVTGLFYAGPGVVSGGFGAVGINPSVSGGSGLENQYVADGVNITDGAFGGLGVFSRVYGSLSTGINLSFVQEVQVKTGGYEPQYGKSTGGIVQIVTKSGTSAYHGSVAGYLAPGGLEAVRTQAQDFPLFNPLGAIVHQYAYDVAGEIGGPVPGLKDKLFFFGSFNPIWNRADGLFTTFHGLTPTPGAVARAPITLQNTVYSYAAKLTWKINNNHTLEGSAFGDPTRSPMQPGTIDTPVLNTFSPTVDDQLAYGTRNVVVRYNGTLSPTWLVNASGSWGHNYLSDSPRNPELNGITNSTAPNPRTNGATNLQCAIQGNCESTGVYLNQGFGYLENTTGDNYGFEIDTQKSFKFLGDHTFSLGYKLDRNFYDGSRLNTGPKYPIPLSNYFGETALNLYSTQDIVDRLTGASSDGTLQIRLRPQCTACPLMPIPSYATPQHVFLYQVRGLFGTPGFLTSGTYHSIYGMDSWSPWKYLTINAGLRWEQQQMRGQASGYTWVGNWSPRIGVIVDPWGDRKTKVYVNFGRYNYAIPLDMAIRSLTNEFDYEGIAWAPVTTNAAEGPGFACGAAGPCASTVAFNPDGTLPTPIFDAAHLLNDPLGNSPGGVGVPANFGPVIGFQSGEAVAPGTKMESVDEWVVGFEHDFGHGVIFSARYIDRRMKRIVEDMAGLSPEAYLAGVPQQYTIGNPGPKTDLFTNPIQIPYDPAGAIPAACRDQTGAFPFFTEVDDNFGNPVASPPGSNNINVCVVPQFGPGMVANYPHSAGPGDPIPDGIPEGFVQPVRNYQAVELEVNKSFSKNWQLRSNWRIARLKGNYEGAFRNDNGQTDPSISSLFDFTAGSFNLLGDQFAIGYLNTDRRHVINTYFSYMFDRTFLKNLTLGTGLRVQTGAPINDLKAHPAYFNAGEIPVGGRGALGRMPTTGQVDIHADYAFKVTEKSKIRLGMDMFNIANMKRLVREDEREDRTYLVGNADFKGPRGYYAYQRPFYARMMLKWEF